MLSDIKQIPTDKSALWQIEIQTFLPKGSKREKYKLTKKFSDSTDDQSLIKRRTHKSNYLLSWIFTCHRFILF